ncbi:TBCC (predicted) [Pycnogonum litorale]
MQMETTNGDELRKRRELVTRKLNDRQKDRLDKLEERESGKERAANERVEKFDETLNKEKEEIEKCLESLASLTDHRQQLSERLDALICRCHSLHKFLSDSTFFLPSYNVRKAQGTVDALLNSVQQKQNELLPAKKFAFRRTKAAATAVKSLSVIVDAKPFTVSAPKNDCGFSDVRGRSLAMDSDQVTDKHVNLERLEECKVVIKGAPSAVHINGLSDSNVLIGPVRTSVFIDDCRNCKFAVPCQQLRVHNSEDCHFYVHVTSGGPIIEDSRLLGFAPFNWSYEDIDEHYASSGLRSDVNNWNAVNDFNWLAVDQHSPNWFVLEEENLVKSWPI